MSNAIILADILEAAGLGGPEPIRAARALLATLDRQPGAEGPDHAAAHNWMVADGLRRYGAALFDGASPEATMLLLARLVAYGVPASEIINALPAPTRQAA